MLIPIPANILFISHSRRHRREPAECGQLNFTNICYCCIYHTIGSPSGNWELGRRPFETARHAAIYDEKNRSLWDWRLCCLAPPTTVVLLKLGRETEAAGPSGLNYRDPSLVYRANGNLKYGNTVGCHITHCGRRFTHIHHVYSGRHFNGSMKGSHFKCKT